MPGSCQLWRYVLSLVRRLCCEAHKTLLTENSNVFGLYEAFSLMMTPFNGIALVAAIYSPAF